MDFFPKKWLLKKALATGRVDDIGSLLEEARFFSMRSHSSMNYELDYGSFLSNGTDNNGLMRKIARLNQGNKSKGKYENMPEELQDHIKILEQNLFYGGKVAIVKENDKFYFFNFIALTYDHYGYPKKIRLRAIASGKELNGSKIVGQDVAVIYNDTSWLIPQVKLIYGPLFRIGRSLLEGHNCGSVINRKINLARTLFLVNKGTTPEAMKQYDRALNSKASFIPVLDASPHQGARTVNSEIVPYDLLTASPDEGSSYHNIREDIEQDIGIVGNINPKKMERQTNVEIQSSNTIAIAVLQAELENREVGIAMFNKVFNLNASVSLNEDADGRDALDDHIDKGEDNAERN